MIVPALVGLAIGFSGAQQGNILGANIWPAAKNPLFAVKGVSAESPLGLRRAIFTWNPENPTKRYRDYAFVSAPGSEWKTLQIVFTTSTDGIVAQIGNFALKVKSDRLIYISKNHQVVISTLNKGANDVQLLVRRASIVAFVNGVLSARSTYPGMSLPSRYHRPKYMEGANPCVCWIQARTWEG